MNYKYDVIVLQFHFQHFQNHNFKQHVLDELHIHKKTHVHFEPYNRIEMFQNLLNGAKQTFNLVITASTSSFG
jgi:hypothetical protein